MVRRKGLLDEIPHVRLIRGMVIVRTEDAERVVALLAELGAEVQVRQVELTREDVETLRGLRVSFTHPLHERGRRGSAVRPGNG